MNNSKLVKIMHIILFVITALYLLESIFLRGLFTNPLIALVNIIVAIIAMVIAFIKKEKKTKIIIDTPKSNSSIREIPINNKLYEILKKMKGKSKKNEYVLTGSDTHYIEPRNYQYHFKVILKKSKIKASYKFHALRHTFATICIEIGMDIKSLSEILGHADVSVTLNVYVHSSDKLKRKFLEKL